MAEPLDPCSTCANWTETRTTTEERDPRHQPGLQLGDCAVDDCESFADYTCPDFELSGDA